MDASSAGTLLAAEASYPRQPGVYDEMCSDQGRIREHFRPFMDRLGALGPAEIERRWQKAQHLIHENGVTYNVYGDPLGLERPWNLSPLPVLVGPEDWSVLTRGLAQRADLFEALLADLYGPGRSLTEGRLPAEIVFSHPNFLRCVHGSPVPRGRFLPLYAADLVRAPDGLFHVIEDRTQAPSGAGYALENRIVISGAISEIFRECNVQRLAGFFRALRASLQSLAPHNRDNPRIVLLTPGPSNATYFEQAYLAQYLGFTLVNGGDLTVRDDRVYLKTLGGLQQVDVILRRVNDDYCDPLELRPDSLLGVPGLVEASRMGNVAIANPLGTGLLQTPAVLPYLPGLCRQLLGEDLVLPSVRTLWCGDEHALSEVLSRLDGLVIKPTFPDASAPPIFTSNLTQEERGDLALRLKAKPAAYVAQEYVPPSTTPSIVSSALAPRAMVLRCYAVATNPNGYSIMPGGLARVADTASGDAVSMQLGARSKDVWVVSHERVDGFSLLAPSNRALELSRGGGDLPSRAADNLYWLGRYAERAENVARLSRVIGARLSELAGQNELERSSEFGALLAALRAQTEFLYVADIPEATAAGLAECEAELVTNVCDSTRSGSLSAVIKSTLRSGRVVRDRISMDTWRVLATLDEELEQLEHIQGPDRLSTLVNLCNAVVTALAAFSGLVMDSMTRGQAFHFLDMGRRLERGVSLVTLLRATTTRTSEREATLLETVLEIADSGMTYRRRYLATLQAAPVIDLLLTDETNPRSVIYQVQALANHIRALPTLPGAGPRNPQLRLAVAALNELELADVEILCGPDGAGMRAGLDVLLRRLGALLPKLSDSLSDSYLNHATVSRHLTHEESAVPSDAGQGGEP